MNKKLTKRQQQALATRQKIYEAAKQLMIKYGLETVGIDDIVQEAGVARGTFYVYFLSKEDLLVYIILEEAGIMHNQISDAWESLDKTKPALDLIIMVVRYICELTKDAGVDIIRTVYKIFIERRKATSAKPTLSFDMPELFISLFNLGVERSEFVANNSEEVATNITTILVGTTFEWCLYEPHYDFVERSISLVSKYLNCYKK